MLRGFIVNAPLLFSGFPFHAHDTFRVVPLQTRRLPRSTARKHGFAATPAPSIPGSILQVRLPLAWCG